MSAVEVVDATKRYGALRALDGVSLSVAPGEVPAPAASRQDHHTTATPTTSDDVIAAAPSSEKRPDDATDTE
jgi:hypothetical protein